MPSQTTKHLLMVRPSHFGYNKETIDNAFQIQDNSLTSSEIQQKALEEFDNFVALLRAAGVLITIIEDTASPAKTDAIFPNNWVSFHEDGTAITYPMYASSRRTERRMDILNQIKEKFHLHHHIHLETHETQNQFLEGTGSMVLDRVNKIAYACYSLRTNETVLDLFCEQMTYQKIMFHAVDEANQPIYHTNVMMTLGDNFAIVCLDTIKDEVDRKAVVAQLTATGKTIFPITMAQMVSFAGNMLQIKNKQGDSFLVMSQQAYEALDSVTQINKLHNYTSILYSPLNTIEKYGGGSARCMIAELFLTLKVPIVEKQERRGRGRKPARPVKTIVEKYVEGKGWVRVQ